MFSLAYSCLLDDVPPAQRLVVSTAAGNYLAHQPTGGSACLAVGMATRSQHKNLCSGRQKHFMRQPQQGISTERIAQHALRIFTGKRCFAFIIYRDWSYRHACYQRSTLKCTRRVLIIVVDLKIRVAFVLRHMPSPITGRYRCI